MKNLMCLMTCLFIGFNVSAQDPIPNTVLEAFALIEPNETAPFWEERQDAYVAMFSDVEGLKKVFFNPNGEWIETRTRIDRISLPLEVQAYINDHYSEAELTYIGIVDQPENSFYRVESEFSSCVVIKMISEEGVLLNENKIDYSLNLD